MKKIISILLLLVLVGTLCLPVLAAGEIPESGYDLCDEVRACIAGWQVGKKADTIERTLDVKENYGYMPLVKTNLLSQINCKIEGAPCDALSGCTWQDIQVLCSQNGELVEFSFKEVGGTVQMQVQFTSAAKKLSTPKTVSGIIYLQGKDGELIHVSEGIPFAFTLTRQATQAPNMLVVVLVAVVAVLFAAVVVVAILLFKKKK